jgi:hypothetical protein
LTFPRSVIAAAVADTNLRIFLGNLFQAGVVKEFLREWCFGDLLPGEFGDSPARDALMNGHRIPIEWLIICAMYRMDITVSPPRWKDESTSDSKVN